MQLKQPETRADMPDRRVVLDLAQPLELRARIFTRLELAAAFEQANLAFRAR
jgi:hypothetical protein